jgi:glycosyltransferase involved in cell wall biosynthesis
MRFEQFVSALAGLGIDVEVAPLLRDEYIERLYSNRPTAVWQILGDYLRRLPSLLQAKRFDLLWIEKELFPDLPGWFEHLLELFGIRYVVDYDDALFHNYDLSANPWRRMLRSKIDAVMRSASLVVCGNDYLADRAFSAGARRVEVVPTVIDLMRYSVRPSVCAEKIVVGWIGSAATVKYLEVAMPALRALSEKYPIQLRVIGADFSAPGIDVDCRPWSEGDEVRQIQAFDIGIMPLTDSPWERGKCGYKLIQYMACGVPVIASPVGINEVIVEDGDSGYLAGNQEAWLDAFKRLASDSSARKTFGTRGRHLVEERYCLQVIAPRLAKLFIEVCISGRGR